MLILATKIDFLPNYFAFNLIYKIEKGQKKSGFTERLPIFAANNRFCFGFYG